MSQLTPRQRQVADKLVEGKQNKVIAHELGMALRTVTVHLGVIYAKLGVSDRVGAVLKLLAERAL